MCLLRADHCGTDHRTTGGRETATRDDREFPARAERRVARVSVRGVRCAAERCGCGLCAAAEKGDCVGKMSLRCAKFSLDCRVDRRSTVAPRTAQDSGRAAIVSPCDTGSFSAAMVMQLATPRSVLERTIIPSPLHMSSHGTSASYRVHGASLSRFDLASTSLEYPSVVPLFYNRLHTRASPWLHCFS